MEALAVTRRGTVDQSDEAPHPPELSPDAVAVIDVGNMSTHLGAWSAMRVTDFSRAATHHAEEFSTAYRELAGRFPRGRPAAVAMASVVPDAVPPIRHCVSSITQQEVQVVGQHVPLPIPVAVREPRRVGVDRVCAAAAAYDRTGHACVVIDFGSAVTVDLVDDEGVFVGGAILPGAAMQARALATFTAALPQVELRAPKQPIGRDTVEAIQSGVLNGLAGAVRGLVEQYATFLNTWPQVVATGGDLDTLLPRCDFIDSAVPGLTLMGVGLAYARHRQTARA